MTRKFSRNNSSNTIESFVEKSAYDAFAYNINAEDDPPEIFSRNYIEYMRYGMIDNNNNSIIPNTDFLTSVDDQRMLDFVADSVSLMKLNLQSAITRNMLQPDGALVNFKVLDAYNDPVKRYGEYLGSILQYYNKTHIPNIIGTYSITSYERYVNNFFKLFFDDMKGYALTMTRFNTSNNSSILDSGLAFKYSDLDPNSDQEKINSIIDQDWFPYFRNICLNLGFKIDRDNPNIVIYDINSPATDGIKQSYGLYSLDYLFSSRFTYTYLNDIKLLLDYINIYYNKYASKNSLFTIPYVRCKNTLAKVIELKRVPTTERIMNPREEIAMYVRIRNHEEGEPFDKNQIREITERSLFFLKTVDKPKSLGYINSIFRDQVWNKNDGFHDLIRKLGIVDRS